MQAVTAEYIHESTEVLATARDDAWLRGHGLTRHEVEQHLQSAVDPAPAGVTSAFSTPHRVAVAPSLLNTASVTVDASTRWWDPGLSYAPDPCCSDGGTWVECPTDATGAPVSTLAKPDPACVPTPMLIKPFVVVTSLTCGMIAIPQYEESYARAFALHTRMLPDRIMSVLATGAVASLAPGSLGHSWDVNGVPGFTPNPYFTAALPVGNDLTPGATAVLPRYGAQVLSSALACSMPGQAGLIIGTPLAFETASYGYGIRLGSGPTLTTPLGNYMIGSCGFDGRAPGTASNTLPNGDVYMYGIGLPSIQISPAWSMGEMARQRGQVASNGWPLNSLNNVTNTWTITIETTVAAAFNPCSRFGIMVNPGISASP